MARYITETTILATLNGVEMTIPVDEGNRHYAELVASGISIEPLVMPTPEEVLAAERATMTCTPLQGILALGEANWKIILGYRETASWAEKVLIDSAQAWKRNSQNIQFFQYLLKFTDEQVDALFRAAILIEA